MSNVVEPQPVPFTFSVQDEPALTTDGQKLVVVLIHTVSGFTKLFMTPEDAENMAGHWLAKAKEFKSRLILPASNINMTQDVVNKVLNGRDN